MTGKTAKTAVRHTSDEFVAFLEQVVSSQPRDRRGPYHRGRLVAAAAESLT